MSKKSPSCIVTSLWLPLSPHVRASDTIAWSSRARSPEAEWLKPYAANFARLGVNPIDATIDRGSTLAAYDVVDEVVLRAITVGGTLAELEQFADEAARWRAAATAPQE